MYRTISDGKSFICIEQYIQYEKAKLFDDQDSAEHIMTYENMYELRAMGRNITGFRYWKWKQHMSSVMKHGIYEKFSKNKDAKKALFETGNKALAEASRDTYWGCGIHITDESVLINDKWEGNNHMGILLMEIMEELVYDSESDEAEISMSASDNDSLHSVTNDNDLTSQEVQDATASTLDVEATEPRGKADNSDDSVYCDNNDDDHDTDDDVDDDHDHDDDDQDHDDLDNDEDNDGDDGHGDYGDHDHYGDGDQSGQGPQEHDHGTDDHDDNGAYDEGDDINCSLSGGGNGDEKNGEDGGSGDNDRDDFNDKNSRKDIDSDAEGCDEMSQMLNEKGKCV